MAGRATLAIAPAGGPVPEGLHQRRYVPPILGRELVDAGDQQLPLLIARGSRPEPPAGSS